MDSNVIGFFVFLVGAIVGGIIVWFVIANNTARAMRLLGITKEQLDKLKGKAAG